MLDLPGVYKITNIKNDKVYIGSATRGIKGRWLAHLAGRNSNLHLQNAIKKYGIENFKFEILEYCCPEMCLEREQFYLDKILPEFKYNIATKAGSVLGLHWKRQPFSQECRNKMSAAAKGRPLTEKHKKNISNGMKGIQNALGSKHSAKTKKTKIECNKEMVEQFRK